MPEVNSSGKRTIRWKTVNRQQIVMKPINRSTDGRLFLGSGCPYLPRYGR